MVNSRDVRSAALSFEGAYEASHMGHPDFRGPKGIFMSLTRGEGAVVFRLPPALGESVLSSYAGAELASKFGGALWIRFKLDDLSPSVAAELSEHAWHFRNRLAR